MSATALPVSAAANESRVLRAALSLVVVLLPAVMTVFLLQTTLGKTPLDFIPTWSDEAIYWHEILTFQAVGFEGGYYTFEELPAPVEFTHFDPHGPVYPAALGLLARVTGWQYPTMVVYNIAFLCAALAIFVLATKPTARQLLWLIAVVLTFWQMHLFIPTTMQESLHQTAAILLALLFLIRLQRKEATPRWIDAVFIGFVAFLSLIRLTWSFLFVPYFVLMQPSRRWWLALVAAGALIAGSVVFYRLFTSPYPSNFIAFFFRQMAENPSLSHALYLLSSFFLENTARIGKGDILTIAGRVQVLALVLWTIAVLVIRRTRLRRRFPRPQMSTVEAGLHLYNVGIMLLVSLTIYVISDWIDYRVFAPHLLFSLLLLVVFNRYRLVGLLIAINIMMTIPFLQNYHDLNLRSFTVNQARLAEFGEDVRQYVVYNGETENAWCNTVYAPRYEYHLITLPPGIGYTIARDLKNVSPPFRSQYLLLTDADYDDLSARFGALNLDPLTETALGTLYRNRDADCD